MRNSFRKIENVAPPTMEHLTAAIYLDFTGFEQKGFIGRAMQMKRRNVAGRSKDPQNAKGAVRLLRTHQNVRFLAKGSDHPAVLVSFGVGGKSVFHRFNTG